MSSIYLGLCIASGMMGLIATVFSMLSYAKVVGMEKSTHRIQYMPAPAPTLEEGIGMTPENASEMMNKLYPSMTEDQ